MFSNISNCRSKSIDSMVGHLVQSEQDKRACVIKCFTARGSELNSNIYVLVYIGFTPYEGERNYMIKSFARHRISGSELNC